MAATQETGILQSIAATFGALAVRPLAFDRSAAWRRFGPAVALAGASAAVLLVQLPVLGHYFYGDDFVPLADIASKGTWAYTRDLFLQRDPTPNWRFLTGLVYLAEYRAFGPDAFPYLLVAVLAHGATAGLIFLLVRRMTASLWPAFLAASFFGLTAAPVPTVGQVTAFNNVLAGFLIMLSLATLYEGLKRGRLGWWLAASVAAFAGAIAANESAAVLAPVPALLALSHWAGVERWWLDARRWTRAALVSAPYAVIGGGAFITFMACRCTEAGKEGVSTPGDHVFGNLWTYLGRLLYPIGMEFPGRVETAHLLAGLVVAALAAALLVRGPALARICVVFLLLALLPYVPIVFALAPRYVYLATIPFSVLAGLLFAELARQGGRLTPALPAALGLFAVAALALHGWQSWEQNRVYAAASDQWRELLTGLDERYPELPAGSRVYVRGGPLTNVLWQFAVLPSVGKVLWGDVELLAVPEGTVELCLRPGGQLFAVDYDGGRFTPVPVAGDGATAAGRGRGSASPLDGPDPQAGAARAVAVDCPEWGGGG